MKESHCTCLDLIDDVERQVGKMLCTQYSTLILIIRLLFLSVLIIFSLMKHGHEDAKSVSASTTRSSAILTVLFSHVPRYDSRV